MGYDWESVKLRWLCLFLIVIGVLLQYPLWFSKGNWTEVWSAEDRLQRLRSKNNMLILQNANLEAEVQDLKQGYDALEELARYELGFVKENEVFVQLPAPDQQSSVRKTY